MTKKVKFVHGGPERKAFNREGVVPVSLSRDPFWDMNIRLQNLEKEIQDGEVSDLLILKRTFPKGTDPRYHVECVWRGHESLVTAYGMMEFAKDLIKENENDL